MTWRWIETIIQKELPFGFYTYLIGLPWWSRRLLRKILLVNNIDFRWSSMTKEHNMSANETHQWLTGLFSTTEGKATAKLFNDGDAQRSPSAIGLVLTNVVSCGRQERVRHWSGFHLSLRITKIVCHENIPWVLQRRESNFRSTGPRKEYGRWFFSIQLK